MSEQIALLLCREREGAKRLKEGRKEARGALFGKMVERFLESFF